MFFDCLYLDTCKRISRNFNTLTNFFELNANSVVDRKKDEIRKKLSMYPNCWDVPPFYDEKIDYTLLWFKNLVSLLLLAIIDKTKINSLNSRDCNKQIIIGDVLMNEIVSLNWVPYNKILFTKTLSCPRT